MQTTTEKDRLRTGAAAARAAAHGARRDSAARALAATFVAGLREMLAPPLCVSLYWPMRDEIDVRPLIAALREISVTVALPVMAGRDRPLFFRAWADGDPLERGGFGVDEPPSGEIVRPDIVVVPLLAFDARGNRLGYGGGYYDRTLAANRSQGRVLAVGVAYDEQEIAAVPTHDRDQRLDVVVTDRRFIDLRPVGGQRG